MTKVCGCGREANWEVYEHKEPHCDLCFIEAAEVEEQILVRRIDIALNILDQSKR